MSDVEGDHGAHHGAGRAPPVEARPSGVGPWIAFDFVNSIVIINGTVHFSSWLAGPGGVDPRWYGLALVLSSVLLLFGLPVLGALIDRTRCGRQALVVTSVAMAALALSIAAIGHWDDGVARAVVALTAFALMNVVYQASLVAYNWLLVYLRGVRTEADVRRVSGYGEAAGSAGSVAGALVSVALLPLLASWGSSEPRIDLFLVLGVVYLGAFLVDHALLRPGLTDACAPTVRLRYHRVWLEGLRVLREPGPLRRFFLAFLLYANAVLTVQFFLPIHMQEVHGFAPSQTALAVALALGAAACGGVAYARVGPRADTRWTILALVGLLAPSMLALGWARNDPAFLALLFVMGFLYGALWGASRAHVIELTHRSRLGRNLAFYAVFERTASVLGPLVWAAVSFLSDDVPTSNALSISAMGLMVVGGGLVMWQDAREEAPGGRRGAARRRRAVRARPA